MPLGILCPGQGGQHPDMLSMPDGEPAAEAVLAAARRFLEGTRDSLSAPGVTRSTAMWSPSRCFAQPNSRPGRFARPAPTPRVFAGYSVGELAAYACAGALDTGELVDLARRPSEAMDRACPEPSGLLAVRGITR